MDMKSIKQLSCGGVRTYVRRRHRSRAGAGMTGSDNVAELKNDSVASEDKTDSVEVFPGNTTAGSQETDEV